MPTRDAATLAPNEAARPSARPPNPSRAACSFSAKLGGDDDASRISSMETLPEQIVAEAFALSNARGADLLVRLGTFRVWQGDLATMRGDDPRGSNASDEAEEAASARDVLLDTLVLAKAIELLQPICRAALAAVYVERKDSSSLAADLDTEPAYAQRIMTNCEQRLLEIYDSLAKSSPADAATIPEWVLEREHAAAGGSRRR